MPRYLVTRTFPPMTPEQLQQVGQDVIGACEELGDIQWVRSHITADGKHSFCEFVAPSADTCRRHAEMASLPVDDVIEVGDEFGPKTFE